jgi:hypothetical protein
MRFLSALTLLALACVPFDTRLYEAKNETCTKVLEEFPATSTDKQYASVSSGQRETYEHRVATCLLEKRQPEQALTLAEPWESQAKKLQIQVRANAQLNQEKPCREALRDLSRLEAATAWGLLRDTPELLIYAHQPWFLSQSVTTWSRMRGATISDLANYLSQVRKTRLLTLKLAAADAQRPPGELAHWLGIVRKSSIDREARQTTLIVEGAVAREVMTEHDRKLTGMTNSFMGAEAEYEETRRYREVFEPTGQMFIITYSIISERLVNAQVVEAFGEFSGHSEEHGWPMLEASVVGERFADEREERGR